MPPTAPAFVPPVAGPTAQIEFVDRSGNTNFHILGLPGHLAGCRCSEGAATNIGIFHNHGILSAGYDQGADRGKATDHFAVTVPATGAEYRFLGATVARPIAQSGNKVVSELCEPHVGFKPQPGKSYQVTYDPAAPCAFSVLYMSAGTAAPVATTPYPMCNLDVDPTGNPEVVKRIAGYCARHPEIYGAQNPG